MSIAIGRVLLLALTLKHVIDTFILLSYEPLICLIASLFYPHWARTNNARHKAILKIYYPV